MGRGIEVSPDELRSTADVLRTLRSRADDIASQAEDADPGWEVWSWLGLTILESRYSDKADEARTHIGMIGDALDAQATALEGTAVNAESLDGAIADVFRQVHDRLDSGGSGGDGGGPVLPNTHAFDRYNPTPLIASAADYAIDENPGNLLIAGSGDLISGVTGMFDDGVSREELGAVASGGLQLAGNAVAFISDPANWLISAGLSFLIDVIQPLEDALSMVTGNSERMGDHVADWEQIGEQLVTLGTAVQQAATEGMIGWRGEDADAAKHRILVFGEAVIASGGEAAKVATLLQAYAAVMSAAQQFLIGLMAQFVEWLIVTWTAALAAAGPTMGGSVASAGAVTTTSAATTTSRAATQLRTVAARLNAIGGHIVRRLPGSMRSAVRDNVERLQGFSTVTAGNAGRALLAWVGDPRNLAPISATVGGAAAHDLGTDGPDMSPDEITEALDDSV